MSYRLHKLINSDTYKEYLNNGSNVTVNGSRVGEPVISQNIHQLITKPVSLSMTF
jgi:hypothetical protein